MKLLNQDVLLYLVVLPIINNKLELVKTLINRWFNIEALKNEGYSSLFIACYKNIPEIVEFFVQMVHPLILGILYGLRIKFFTYYSNLTPILYKNGININAKDNEFKTPLFASYKLGNKKCAQICSVI